MGKQNDEVAELRAATREAHEAMKDIKALMKEAREVLGELKAAATAEVDTYLEQAVQDGLAELGKSIEKACDDATEAVYKRFDTITDLILGEDRENQRKGNPSVEQMIRDRQGGELIQEFVRVLEAQGAVVEVVPMGPNGPKVGNKKPPQT